MNCPVCNDRPSMMCLHCECPCDANGNLPSDPPTLDEWCEKNSSELRQDVNTHIKVMAEELTQEDQDSLERLIMISVRKHIEQITNRVKSR